MITAKAGFVRGMYAGQLIFPDVWKLIKPEQDAVCIPAGAGLG
jgi:hypothetical protein